MKELEENSPGLLRIHDDFMKIIRTSLKNTKVVSIAEGSPTMLTTFKFPLTIVNENSAYINYGDFYVLKDDHLSLSKPIFRQSFLYQKLLKVVNDSLKETKVGNESDNHNNDKKEIYNKKSFDWKVFDWKILETLPDYLNKFLV